MYIYTASGLETKEVLSAENSKPHLP